MACSSSSSSSSSSFTLPDLPVDSPNQPDRFDFPQCPFGKTKVVHRSFQASWFKRFNWLHYNTADDLAYCFTCVRAVKTGKIKLSGHVKESAFIYGGFSNWKDGTRGFTNHENSGTHKSAVEVVIAIPQSTGDVGEMLFSSLMVERQMNRKCLLKIAENIKFLARQGIAFCGDGDEKDSNFMQLVYLWANDDSNFLHHLQRKSDRYTSPQIQNELLKLMAVNVLRDIAKFVQKYKYFSLMADEVTDISNKEQVLVCLRSVDDDLIPHENFIGIHSVDSIKSDILVAVLRDTLLRMNLPIQYCRGQCYDGAANMVGIKNGVAAQIAEEESRSIFIHCYGHALNLAAGDCIKNNRILCDALDVTFEMSKLIKYSPRRGAIYEKLKGEMAPDVPGFRTLCPTRWTVRASSLESVICNYTVLQALWEEARDVVSDSDTRARLIGVDSMMSSFDYFFGIVLGERILKHTDNLSKTLQNPLLSASEGQELAVLTCDTLALLRTTASFDLFWDHLLLLQTEKGVGDPCLPRKRRMPARYQAGSSSAGYHPESPKDFYRQQYFECLDMTVNCIQDRFNQPGYKVLKNLKNVIIKTARGQDCKSELDFVVNFYKDDINPSLLRQQLDLLTTKFSTAEESPGLQCVVDYLKSLSLPQRDLISEVVILVKLILVIPATNAVSERSASAVRRLKTYLRSTMTQTRLNNLLVLHVHKQRTDDLNLTACLSDFVSENEHRHALFGTF